MRHSDEQLAARARGGDERAFELLVRRHRAALVSYCRRLGLDGRADDAVQQAFLSAWLALRRGQEVRDVRSWLGRIAHNKAVDLLRAGAEAPQNGLSAGAAPGGLEQTLELRHTLAEVAALPPRQREALLLSAIDGRSYEEVAAALGVSEGAVRGLLHRARATLRAAAGALAPLPLVRAPAGWFHRASIPLGKAAELAAPSAGGNTASATWRAAAAAVTTVAVGPLHGLVGGHARHRGPRATSPAGPRVPALARAASSRESSAARGTVGSGPTTLRSASASSGLAAPTARAPLPTTSAGGQAPGTPHHQSVTGVAPPEPGPAAAPAPTPAAVASAPAGAEAPVTSAPVAETPPVAEQPEAAKPTEPPSTRKSTSDSPPATRSNPRRARTTRRGKARVGDRRPSSQNIDAPEPQAPSRSRTQGAPRALHASDRGRR